MTVQFRTWKEFRPKDIHRGQVLLWKTKHIRLGVGMVMSGPIHNMHNGWENTDHLLPPMTRWDGYRHLIPADLEWAYAPGWIKEQATYTKKDRWGKETTYVNEHALVRLLEVQDAIPLHCPFCGGAAKWESRDGFIGSMPHQENQFSVGCCMRTAYYSNPADAVARWNRRVTVTEPPAPEYF
jgi:hypothetical protein